MFCRESQAALIFTFSDAGGGQTRMEASGSIDLDAPDFGPSTTAFPQAGTRFAFQQNGSNPSVGLSSFDLTAGGNDFFSWSNLTRIGNVDDVFLLPSGQLEGNPASLPLGTTPQGYSLNVSSGGLTVWMNVGDAAPTTWSPGTIDTLLDIDFSNFGAPGASFSYQPTADPDNLLTFQVASSAAVPEPSSAILLAFAAGGLVVRRRRRGNRTDN